MVDTVRSLSALQALLADNLAGDISAQDLRDFLVTALSVASSYSTVTTADVTAELGAFHALDISGLTANRNFILPTGSVGDTIQVSITAGNPDFELLFVGAATVTINSGVAATEWSRLFITGETITLKATNTTNWQVVNDGRIRCCYDGYSSGLTHGGGGYVYFNPSVTSVSVDTGSINDAVNNRPVIRRSGDYTVTPYAKLAGFGQNKTYLVRAEINGTTALSLNGSTQIKSSQNSGDISHVGLHLSSLSVGDYIRCQVYSNDVSLTAYAGMAVLECL